MAKIFSLKGRNPIESPKVEETMEIMSKEKRNRDVGEKKDKCEKGKIKIVKYIGETSRSASERAEEHKKDLKNLDAGSHFLKHIIKTHMSDPENVEFRIKILSSHFTAFNRQITEAVRINRSKGPYLLNSKAEYNRSGLPILKTSDKKSPRELSDLDDYEIKEAVKILKEKGKKLAVKMNLIKENEENK